MQPDWLQTVEKNMKKHGFPILTDFDEDLDPQIPPVSLPSFTQSFDPNTPPNKTTLTHSILIPVIFYEKGYCVG